MTQSKWINLALLNYIIYCILWNVPNLDFYKLSKLNTVGKFQGYSTSVRTLALLKACSEYFRIHNALSEVTNQSPKNKPQSTPGRQNRTLNRCVRVVFKFQQPVNKFRFRMVILTSWKDGWLINTNPKK